MPPVWEAVLELSSLADEASYHVGGMIARGEEDFERDFLMEANRRLDNHKHGATLCIEVDPFRMRVLPKMHTPQTGLTIRSLSANLSLCPPCEVIPQWYSYPNDVGSKPLNLLLVPWPYSIFPSNFRAVNEFGEEMANMNRDRFGFFTCDIPEKPEVVDVVKRLMKAAKTQVGAVDLVVLPELSVTEKTYGKLRLAVRDTGAMLVCGYGRPAQDNKPGTNQAGFDLAPWDHRYQRKHHRWRLSDSQLRQYGLTSILTTDKHWWEYVSVTDRQFLFHALSYQFVLAVLICEDLARPDPVGDLIRSVGPNLVIALLLDGPQLGSRWAGRYATVLADDPGSSVLALTSFGAARMSRPLSSDQPTRSNVIALWRDARHSMTTEISVPGEGCGVLLTLSPEFDTEWTADGRPGPRTSLYPTLTSVRPICP